MDGVGDVPGGQLAAQGRAQPAGQIPVELLAGLEGDVQHQPPVPAELTGVDHEAVGYLRERLDDPVELAGAHPDAAAVQRRVRPPVDDTSAVGQDLDPVAVPPHAGEVRVVAVAVARAVRVVPEAHRHRGHRLGDDQLAHLADHRLTGGAERLHRCPEAAARDHARPDRQQRARPHEAGAQVGAAGERTQDQIALDVPVDPLETLGRQRRSGRAQPAQRGKIQLTSGGQAGLGAGEQVGRAHPEVADLLLGDDPPQGVGARERGAAVVGHHGRPGQQAAREEVPHHPAGRGVPEKHVPGPQVLVEREGLEMLQDDAAVTVHDRLGQAGGARGVQHPQRMIERHVGVVRLGQRRRVGAGLAQVVPVQDLGRRRPGQ